ncbi:hypothetical protein [Robertkochia aurantiaca]|uniref:hypothetical protein n=1 Tax=Robertkochia aurantiaca TaxID=2873700 RepID=UPI001CCFA170|nr:hypothetical protein [Robertkochia sp. 3YJGBD-33]
MIRRFTWWPELNCKKFLFKEIRLSRYFLPVFSVLCVIVFLIPSKVWAQQFVGDNQWVAPKGVFTIVGTAGQRYSQFYLVGALIQEWEFNAQFTHYYDDPRQQSSSYTATWFYLKRRFWQNSRETAGYAVMGGTGLNPQHLDKGVVTQSFDSWFINGVATYSFFKDQLLWDFLPGAQVNLNYDDSDKTAWGFTYSSRAALYNIIPQSAIVAEVFGTSGAAFSPVSYRAGIRYESPKWIFTLTYSSAFDNSVKAGLEFGFMYFTPALFGKNSK